MSATEKAQNTIECMDSWARAEGLPTYSALLGSIREIEEQADMRSPTAYAKALADAFALLARAGGAA